MNPSSHLYTVPQGMSPVNAFYALWQGAQTANALKYLPNQMYQQAQEVNTVEKVAALFQETLDFDYVGGRAIKTDFTYFPEINTSRYNLMMGEEAAEEAIELYNQIPSHLRFDRNDSQRL